MRKKKNAIRRMTVKIFIKEKPHGNLQDAGKVIDDVVGIVGKFSPYVEVHIEA